MPSNERCLIPMIPEHTHLQFHTSAVLWEPIIKEANIKVE